MAITPRERFHALFDGGVFGEIDVPAPVDDPLVFKDQKKYPERMKAARKGTGEREAMLVAEGEIGRTPIIAAAQDFSFMAGSMGMYVGNAIIAAAERAVASKRPLVLFSAAGGARMQEGILSLMQMPRTTVAVQMLKEAGLPYIVVLTHPTTGGVTASYAMLGDVHIAEPNALICFAGPRVIEQTIREKLPEGFQRAEYLLDHGMLDRVTHRKAMKDELVTIIRMLTGSNPSGKGRIAQARSPCKDRRKGRSPQGRSSGRRADSRGPKGVSTQGSDIILERMMVPSPKDHRPDIGPRLAAATGRWRSTRSPAKCHPFGWYKWQRVDPSHAACWS